MLAYSFPLLSVFLSLMFFFIWIVWLVLLFRVVADVFRSDDMNGLSKAIWLIFVIALPYLGVLVYVIIRGTSMNARDLDRARSSEAAMQEYIRSAVGAVGAVGVGGVGGGGDAGGGAVGVAEELTKLATLRDQGVLSATEFDAQKAKLLA